MVRAHRDGKCVSHDPDPAWSYYHLMHSTLVSALALKLDMIAWAIPLWFLINSGTLKEWKARFYEAAQPLFGDELII